MGSSSPQTKRDGTRFAAWLKALRLRMPGGLSARLLLLTALFVILGELMIIGPSLAVREDSWLVERVRLGELASEAADASAAGPSEQVADELTKGAGVLWVAWGTRGSRRMLPSPALPRLIKTPELIDLRTPNPVDWLLAPFRTLAGPPRLIRVMARPQYRVAEFIEVVAPDTELRVTLTTYLLQLLAVTAFLSILAGVLVYLALNVFLVAPMRRITQSMERFRERPEDPAAVLIPSGRRDEIGRAEAELGRMQDDLRTALHSQARLAQLGMAVAKINHDLRNMLTSAQMASERLAGSGDPRVTKALPRLERALDRAVRLAEDVLTYGRTDEAAPLVKTIDLGAAAETAGEDAGLSPEGVALEINLPVGFAVRADPDQLHRILVNLFRNAREALEAGEGGRGRVKVTAERKNGRALVRIADTGPGVPAKARARLFEPFVGSGRPGGAGLGLAIARDIARGHGGELLLAASKPPGAVFELTLPDGDQGAGK